MEKAEFYRNARHDLTGPLHGVTVIEATTTWAGPMAGCVLADFGATVIMTSDKHQSGSDRIADCADQLGWPDDFLVVNLQDDEPALRFQHAPWLPPFP